MDLILWRHADAGNPLDDAVLDLQRPLSPKGARHAARIAEWLQRALPERTRVLVSPALRCQQTAKALGRKFRTVEAIAPDAGPAAVLAAARWPESSEPVLVVGHQPTLGLVASLLLAGTPQPWSVKKGAVWWLRSRDREGGAPVVLHAVLGPDGL